MRIYHLKESNSMVVLMRNTLEIGMLYPNGVIQTIDYPVFPGVCLTTRGVLERGVLNLRQGVWVRTMVSRDYVLGLYCEDLSRVLGFAVSYLDETFRAGQ